MGTIKLFGVEFPDKVKCDWCGKPDACFWDRVAYVQPCFDCRQTPKYLEVEQEAEKRKSADDAYKNAVRQNTITSVWQGKGKDVLVNANGDIVSEHTHRPHATGRKGEIKNY